MADKGINDYKYDELKKAREILNEEKKKANSMIDSELKKVNDDILSEAKNNFEYQQKSELAIGLYLLQMNDQLSKRQISEFLDSSLIFQGENRIKFIQFLANLSQRPIHINLKFTNFDLERDKINIFLFGLFLGLIIMIFTMLGLLEVSNLISGVLGK